MSAKTKTALLGVAVMSVLVTGCGIVLDARPWHVFGAVLFIAALSFAMDVSGVSEKS